MAFILSSLSAICFLCCSGDSSLGLCHMRATAVGLGFLGGNLRMGEGMPLLVLARMVKSTSGSCVSLMTTLLDFGGPTGTKVEEVALG